VAVIADGEVIEGNRCHAAGMPFMAQNARHQSIKITMLARLRRLVALQ
jgi:hypothetical protein